MKKIITALALVATIFAGVSFAYDTNNTNEGKVYASSKMDTSIPSRFAPSDNKDIAYWLKVLPFEEYRYHDQYVVLPDMGAIAPIVELDKDNADYKKAIKGQDFDYYKYLMGGTVIYPGTATIGQPGNTFLFGHSNYWVKEPGKFKTIFRLLYNMQVRDKIWVYKKIDGKWMFYEYTTTMSSIIKANDTRILLPEKDGSTTLTLSSCYPIGTAKERRIAKGTLTKTQSLDAVLNPSLINKTAPKIKKRTKRNALIKPKATQITKPSN